MDKIIGPHEFAITVVSANPLAGTPEFIAQNSMLLYKAAYKEAVKHNEPINQKSREQQEEEIDAAMNVSF